MSSNLTPPILSKGGIKYNGINIKIDQLNCCRLLAIRYLISEINVPNITIFTSTGNVTKKCSLFG